MRNLGFPIGDIAERLGCSVRHISRNLQGVRKGQSISSVINTEYEKDLWAFYYNKHRSFHKVAWLFGVSTQLVWSSLKDKIRTNGEFIHIDF